MREGKMKKVLTLLMTPVLLMVLAAPVSAQANLPYTADLVIGEGQAALGVGELTVSADGTVSFQIGGSGTDWRLAETQLYAGDVPPLKIKPDRFPYQHEGLGGNDIDEYTIDITAIDLNGDGIIYIAARAELIRQVSVKKNGKIIYADETAWAQGDEFTGHGKNWITFFTVTRSPVG
jgi:hypothetical protein